MLMTFMVLSIFSGSGYRKGKSQFLGICQFLNKSHCGFRHLGRGNKDSSEKLFGIAGSEREFPHCWRFFLSGDLIYKVLRWKKFSWYGKLGHVSRFYDSSQERLVK